MLKSRLFTVPLIAPSQVMIIYNRKLLALAKVDVSHKVTKSQSPRVTTTQLHSSHMSQVTSHKSESHSQLDALESQSHKVTESQNHKITKSQSHSRIVAAKS